MKKISLFFGQAMPSCTSSARGKGGIGINGRLKLAAGLALCMLGLWAGSDAAVAASSPQEGAMRPAEEWGTTQGPSAATPDGGRLSIGRDEKNGDIEMSITAPRQNADPNAWQQPPLYLAPQVYPGTGASGGYQPNTPGYQSGYQPGYRPGYQPGYRPGYRPHRPGFHPPYSPGYPNRYPNRYPSGQTGWPGAPSQPWPPSSGQYPGYPGTGQYPGYPGTGQYPNRNPGGLYPPPTDGWHWYPGYQGDQGPYPPGVMPLNEGMGSMPGTGTMTPGTGGMTPRTGISPYGRMPSFRRR